MAREVIHISLEKYGGHNLIWVAQWHELDAKVRFEVVTARKVQFLDDDGHTIPMREALENLKFRVV